MPARVVSRLWPPTLDKTSLKVIPVKTAGWAGGLHAGCLPKAAHHPCREAREWRAKRRGQRERQPGPGAGPDGAAEATKLCGPWRSVGITLEARQHLHFSFLLLKAPGPFRMDSGLNVRSPFWVEMHRSLQVGRREGEPHPAAPLPRVVSGPRPVGWHQENPGCRRGGPQPHAPHRRGQHAPICPGQTGEPVSSFIRKSAVCPGRSFAERSNRDDRRGT